MKDDFMFARAVCEACGYEKWRSKMDKVENPETRRIKWYRLSGCFKKTGHPFEEKIEEKCPYKLEPGGCYA